MWFLIREQGVAGLQERLRRDVENAQALAKLIDATDGWRVLAPGRLQTVCKRHEPRRPSAEDLDRHTRRWADRVNASGQAYLTRAIPTRHAVVRCSLGS